MKKFFFFGSSTDKIVCSENSHNGRLNDQQNKRENNTSKSHRNLLFETQKHLANNGDVDTEFGLRRSRSFSSAAFLGNTREINASCLSDQSSSPSTSSGSVKAQQHNQSSRCHTLSPERHVRTKRIPTAAQIFQASHNRSRNTSLSSSDVSNKVLDLYIDGEQHHQRGSPMSKTSSNNRTRTRGGKKPPRVHSTAPGSPTDSIKDKPRTHSFRGVKATDCHFSSRDWVETGFVHGCPQELARHVVEKLCQSRNRLTNSVDHDPDVPITIEDVYSGSMNRDVALKLNNPHNIESPSDRYNTSTNEHQAGYNNNGSYEAGNKDDLDVELESKLKEAQDRILLFSEELEQESFLQDVDFNVPALVQRIRSLTEEKISLALDVSAVLESQLADRTSLKEQLMSARLELDSRTQRLQEEKNEVQSALEKELDRRSSDWSSKVEKCKAEEQRLRERVRELAEQNVSLQREVSSFSEIETERKNTITSSEKQIKELTSTLESAREENEVLHQSFCELQDKYKMTEEERDYIQKRYREKEEECKELHSCITRSLRTCNEQEKTIDGLRGELAELVQKKHHVDSFDKHIQKLHMEQMRLTGVEQVLRREIESFKQEVDSLRHENVHLLERLKSFGKGSDSITFKLDEELSARLLFLQKQGLSLLNESINLSSKLLESIKRISQSGGKKDGQEGNTSLDTQFIIESDMKVQGFRRGTESLMRGLQNISTTLHEKPDLVALGSDTQIVDDDKYGLLNGQNSQDLTRFELKAEKLLTSLLRDKLYSKDQEVEQVQAELATAARSNDILRCEVQNALDSLSCATHKMKELELQLMKKEDEVNQLQNDLHESTKELTVIRGVLPKVTEERDMMWEEVKQYTEKNMLSNSEVNMLKKKIDTLEEDILLKEGQITILKDSLGSKSFDLLASPDQMHEFLLE